MNEKKTAKWDINAKGASGPFFHDKIRIDSRASTK